MFKFKHVMLFFYFSSKSEMSRDMTFMDSLTPTPISINTSAPANMQCSKQLKNSHKFDKKAFRNV